MSAALTSPTGANAGSQGDGTGDSSSGYDSRYGA